MTQAKPTDYQFLCDVANRIIWPLIHARTVKRAAAKTKLSQVRLGAELLFDHPEHGKTLLDLAGMSLRPYSKGRVPLVFGSTDTVRSIVGSVLALFTSERVLYGQVQFASDPKAQEIAAKWNTGELSHDVTMEFSINSGTRVGAGKTYFGFTGPFLVANEWSPTAVRLAANQ